MFCSQAKDRTNGDSRSNRRRFIKMSVRPDPDTERRPQRQLQPGERLFVLPPLPPTIEANATWPIHRHRSLHGPRYALVLCRG